MDEMGIITPETEGKIFPWLVILVLENNGKILLVHTPTGYYTKRCTLPKEFGGTLAEKTGGVEFSYNETIENIFKRYSVIIRKVWEKTIVSIRTSYRPDLKNYQKVLIWIKADAVVTGLNDDTNLNFAGWFFPEDISFLNISEEDKKIVSNIFFQPKKLQRAAV